MNKQIEEKVSKCGICRNKLPKETPIPSEIPSRPWSSVSNDLWEFAGIKHLIAVDAYSGFFEVDVLNDESAFTTISCLKNLFATHGILDEYKSDNGPEFDCREFIKFCRDRYFEHVTSSPRFAQSNGRVERAVETAKILFSKAHADGKDPYLALLSYRNTPRDNLVGSPAQKLMGRRTKTLLHTTEALLKPATIEPNIVQARLHKYMKDGKTHFDVNAKDSPKLELGDTVRFQDGKVWKPAKVVMVHSKAPRSYMVDTLTGRVLRRNRRHLLRTREGDILNPAKAHYKAARRGDDHHIPPSPVI